MVKNEGTASFEFNMPFSLLLKDIVLDITAIHQYLVTGALINCIHIQIHNDRDLISHTFWKYSGELNEQTQVVWLIVFRDFFFLLNRTKFGKMLVL